MADLAALVLDKPDNGHGVETGVLGAPPLSYEWRLVVEILLPADDGSVVGAAVVGTDVVSDDVWTDITSMVTAFTVTDGLSDWGEHPQPSTANITLRPDDVYDLAAWRPLGTTGSPHRYKAGTPIRVVMNDPGSGTVWQPLFTGEISQVAPQTAGRNAVELVDISAVDTVSSRLPLAQITDIQLERGGGAFTPGPPDITDNVDTLLENADWPYGSVVDVQADDSGNVFSLRSDTLVSGTTIQVLRMLGDAVGRQVSADRYGRLAFVRRRPQLYTYSNATTPAADPNEPPAFTVDTSSDAVIADSINPAGADAYVNYVRAERVWKPGIYGGATVDPDPVLPQRLGSGSQTTVRWGYETVSTATPIGGQDFDSPGWRTVEASDLKSQATYGRRSVVLSFDQIQSLYGEFVAEQLADNLVDIYADDLWTVPLTLDKRELVKAITCRVGAPATVDHEDATFTGTVASVIYTMDGVVGDGIILDTDIIVHATSLERPTP